MVLGFTLLYQDMDAHMLEKHMLNDCSSYSNIYDLDIVNTNFSVPKRAKNISSTYDGYTIVSEKFKAFCTTEGYLGLEFVVLPKANGFYWFKVLTILQCDIEVSTIRFLEFNESCNGYKEIVGVMPICLKGKPILSDGFYRTDICSGSNAGKSPFFMVGEVTKQKLKAAGFKELYFEPILDRYDWQK